MVAVMTVEATPGWEPTARHCLSAASALTARAHEPLTEQGIQNLFSKEASGT